MGFNKIILEGRLTKDVELRYSQGGIAMAKGNIAVGKKFTSNGEKKEKTLFVNLQFWQRSAEIFNQYCRKGSHILVEGELENANWVDQNGNKKYDFIVNVSNLQLLGTKDDSTPASGGRHDTPAPQTQQPMGYDGEPYQKTQHGHPSYDNGSATATNNRQFEDKNQSHTPSMDQEVPEIDIDENEIPF